MIILEKDKSLDSDQEINSSKSKENLRAAVAGRSMKDLKKANFGLKNRDMARALSAAARELGSSEQTIRTNITHYNEFANFIKEQGVKDLRKITKDHVLKYGEYLKSSRAELSASTLQNKLSSINSALAQARQDNLCKVCPVKDLKLKKRSNIATLERPSFKNLDKLPLRLSALINVSNKLGLRQKEMTLLNARVAYSSAIKSGEVTIYRGTKGGLTRTIPITKKEQILALEKAADLQDSRLNNLIESGISLKQQMEKDRNTFRSAGGGKFHNERHCYANDRYEELYLDRHNVNVKSPVRAKIEHGKKHHIYLSERLNSTIKEAKAIDKSIRLIIAKELGHSRIDVTNSYLG